MLEQQDLEMIRIIMREELDEKLDTRFEEFEEKLDKKIDKKLDKRFEEFEEKLDRKIDEKLDKRFEEFEEKLDTKLDARFEEFEENLDKKLDVRFRESENLILEEVDRLHNITMKQMSTMQKKMDEMEQYYRIDRLENDNTALLLKITENLTRRVERLEAITA